MKKQITLAIMLAFGSSMITSQLDGLNSYQAAVGAESLNALAQINRVLGMTSKSANRIKVSSAIAALTSFATLATQSYKGSKFIRKQTASTKEETFFINTLINGDYFLKNVLDAVNSIRMYRNANNLAKSNKKDPKSFLKAKVILISSILLSKGSKVAQDFTFSSKSRNNSKFREKIEQASIPTNLLLAYVPALYELGLYDGLKKAQKATASQDDLDEDDDE